MTGAQAALESGWGTSALARAPYNNQFGIKASDDWTGRVVKMPTKEYLNGAWVAVNADFRAYDDINDSVADHAKFFTSTEWRKSNYKAVIGETDYKKACYAVKAAGYATDPDYASKLINIIEKYKLYEWDKEAQSGTIPTASDDVEVVSNLQPKSKIVGGDLSDAGRAFGKQTGVSVIGDSLGVGTEPHLVKLIPNSNYDVKGSRQITHTDSTLNGTVALQNMKNAGKLKQNVVVILGTNRGLTASEIDNFMSICGPERKVLWVETASAVRHNLSANEEMRKAATRHKNAFVLGWYDMVGGLRKEYYAKDDIHMTYMGYFNHAKAIVQGVYEMSTGDFDSSVAQTTTMQFEGIKGFKLSEDGKLEYTDENKVKQVIQTEFRGLSTDGKTNYIYNVSANNTYNPQTGATEADWLEGRFESSELKGLDLFMAACRDMMNRGEPEATYRVVLSELPKGIEIGAEGTIVDTASNPPRYITARVSEITTSQTNPEFNEVVISNVVEVKPFEKPTTLLVQEELRKNRDKLNTDYKERILESDLNSMGGLVLATEESETTLIADVEVEGENVTEHYSDFRWERQSNNAESDKNYNEILSKTENGMTLNVSDKDIEGEESNFICRIYDDAGNLVRTIMKKMVSQVKIKKEIDTVLDRFDTERTETEKTIKEALDSAKAEAERLDSERQTKIDTKINEAKEIAINLGDSLETEKVKTQALLEGLGVKPLSETHEAIVKDINNVLQMPISQLTEGQTKALQKANEALSSSQNVMELVSNLDVAGNNLFSLNEAKQLPVSKDWVVDAKVYQITGLEPNTYYTLSSNAPIPENISQTPIYFNGSRTDQSGVWLGNPKTKMTDQQGKITIYFPYDNDFRKQRTDEIISGKYEVMLNKGEIAQLWRPNIYDNQIKINSLYNQVSLNSEGITKLDDGVKQNTTDISVLNGEIKKRLTQTEVNNVINNKGFATVTYTDNKTKETSEAFNQELSKVVMSIPTGYTNNNLFAQSKVVPLAEGSGVIVSNPQYRGYVLPVKAGERYLITRYGTTNNRWRAYLTVSEPKQGVPHKYKWRYDTQSAGVANEVRIDNGYHYLFLYLSNQADEIPKIKIELVSKNGTSTPWTPSIEDGYTVGDFDKFYNSEYNKTAAEIKSRLSSVEQSTNALNTNFNQRVETALGTSTLITSIKSSIPNDVKINELILADKAIKDTRHDNQPPSWYRTNYPLQTVKEFKTTGAIGLPYIKDGQFAILETIVTWRNTSGGTIKQTATNNMNDVYTRRGLTDDSDWTEWEREVSRADYHKVEETASLFSRTLGSTEGDIATNISRTIQTSGLIQSEVGKLGYVKENLFKQEYSHHSNSGYNSNWTSAIIRGLKPNEKYTITYAVEDGNRFGLYSNNSAKDIETWTTVGTSILVDYHPTTKGQVINHTFTMPNGHNVLVIYLSNSSGSVKEVNLKVETGDNSTEILASAEGVMTRTSQTREAISLGLYGVKDAISEVGIVKDGVRIKGSNIVLDGQVNMTSSFIVPEGNIGNLSAKKITSGTIDTARLNSTDIVTKGLTSDVIKSEHILANEALFKKLFTDDLATQNLATKRAWIKTSMIGDAQIGTAQIGQIDAGTGKIVNIDAQYITANHAKLVSAGFQGLNSNMHIDGGAIRINNNDGDFATMNAIPEFRSQDSAGTSAILGKGRSQYYSNNQSRFYIGSSLNGDEVNGKVVHGVHISKGQTWGIYRQSDAFGGTPAQYFKTPKGWGAVNVVEELMRTGKVVNNFNQASARIRGLNGWGNSFPVLQPGDMVMYQAAVAGNSSGIERIWTMGTSSNGATRTYSHVHHVFEGGTSGVSDARLKHDIKPTDIKALDHITGLSFKQFKWNRNDELEPLGLIAQESGILRVPDEEMEGIDLQRAMMLALKGIQELSQKLEKMGA